MIPLPDGSSDTTQFSLPIPLIKGFLDERVTVVVGAGLSRSAGLPGGFRLASALFEELKRDLEREGNSKAIEELERSRGNLKQVSTHFDAFYKSPGLAKSKVRELILREMPKVNTEGHQVFAALPVIFDVITTNYDRLIEQNQGKSNYSVVYEKEGTLVGRVDRLRSNIIKMHGDIEDESSMILTRDDYDKYDISHPHLIKELQRIFSNKILVIIGYSAEDDNFRRILCSSERPSGSTIYWVSPTKEYFKEIEWPGALFIQRDGIEFVGDLSQEIQSYQELNPKETMAISKKAETRSDQNPFKFYKTDSIPMWDFGTVAKFFVEPLDFASIAEPGTHTILEGDRGSGKSIVLRYLAAETQLSIPPEHSHRADFMGFYVKLDPGLVSTTKHHKESKEDWVLFFTHFLNLLITERVVETLQLCRSKGLLALQADSEAKFADLIASKIGTSSTMSERSLGGLLRSVRFARDQMATSHKRERVGERTSTRFVYELIEYLGDLSEEFREKAVYFLLDEVDNLDEDQLKVLVLFLRSRDAPISFKIAVKTGSMRYVDPFGKRLQSKNDFEVVYCDRFIKERTSELVRFFEMLANTRLVKSGYQIKVRELLPSDPNQRYAGFTNYCVLSSGIVRVFVTLVKDTVYHAYPEICEQRVDLQPIPAKRQMDVIRVKSRIHFNNFGGCEHPLEVRALVDRLGGLFRTILGLSKQRIAGGLKGELRTVSQIEVKDPANMNEFTKRLLHEATENHLLQVPLIGRLQEADAPRYHGYKMHRLLIPYFSIELPNRFPRTVLAEQMNLLLEVIHGRRGEEDFIKPIVEKLSFDEPDSYPTELREFDYYDDHLE